MLNPLLQRSRLLYMAYHQAAVFTCAARHQPGGCCSGTDSSIATMSHTAQPERHSLSWPRRYLHHRCEQPPHGPAADSLPGQRGTGARDLSYQPSPRRSCRTSGRAATCCIAASRTPQCQVAGSLHTEARALYPILGSINISQPCGRCMRIKHAQCTISLIVYRGWPVYVPDRGHKKEARHRLRVTSAKRPD
jgi:hypothetical protein